MKPSNTQKCGSDCLQIIFNYLKKPQNYSDLLDYNNIREGINYIYDLGFVALKLGFQAKIISWDFYIFGGSGCKVNIKKYIQKRKYYGIGKNATESLINFIDAGGSFELRIPTIKDITTYLKKKVPVIIGIRPKIIKDGVSARFLHYIVLINQKGDKYKVVDPCGEEYYINKSTLIYAWYSRMAQILVITD